MNEGPTAPRAEGGHLHDHGEGDTRAFDQELAAAQELQAQGDVAGARALLEKAVRHTPADQRARNLIGLLLFKLGDLERAETIYRGLIEDHPADPTLRVNLGLVFLKRGASNDAARCFTTALDLQPEHAKAQNYLGLAFAQKGEHASARDWFVRSGNTAMAERMTALLTTAAESIAAHPHASQAARGSSPGNVGTVTDAVAVKNSRQVEPPGAPSKFSEQKHVRSITAEFARVRPSDPHGAPVPPAESTLRPVEIGRIAIPSNPTLKIPSNPNPRVVPKTLPTWPAQPSGSTLEGAAAAMESIQQPARDPVADTDPSLAPPVAANSPSANSPSASVANAASRAAATDPAPALSPSAAPAASGPSTPPPSTPAVVSMPAFVETPAAATASSSGIAPPASSPSLPHVATASSAGAPRPVDPTPLSSYTNQRRLEVPAAESSFSIGTAELVIHVRGEMLTRLDGLVASWGTATVRPELKRFRGKATDKAFGEGTRRMLRVSGEGRYVIAREGRAFTPLELGDEPAYFREEVLFAFEESLVFENGRVPSKLGGDLHLVHLRGRGRLLLVSAGEPRSVEVKKGEPLRIPMGQLVGWHGPLIQPRVVPIVDDAPEFGIALELAGEGRALVDSTDEAI